MTHPTTDRRDDNLPGPTPASARRATRIGVFAAAAIALGGGALAVNAYAAQPDPSTYVSVVDANGNPIDGQFQVDSIDTGATTSDRSDCPGKGGSGNSSGNADGPAPAAQSPQFADDASQL